MYAIVDIETTGSFAAENGITEIAIHIFDGYEVTEQYESLVNPLQPIPPFIQHMTGISNAMVSKAPSFAEIAEKVFSLLKGRVFVAHNVQFDYSFVKAQLKANGFELNSAKLCTVRLSRQILPGLPSYSLGKLCHSIGISLANRHRAGGDTAATVALFQRLLKEDHQNHIAKSLKRNSKEWILPPYVPKSQFDRLPAKPGVYYFHDATSKVVYVGKAINIRYRVNSHFSNDAPHEQKQRFVNTIHHITFRECATPFMASLLESAEIHHRWPRFNSAQKKWEDVYGIHLFEDQLGYLRLAIDKNRKMLPSFHRSHYLIEGQATLRKLIRDHQLCLRMCFLQTTEGPCEGTQEGFCQGACVHQEMPATYNERVRKACQELLSGPSYAIVEKGLQKDEQSCVLVEAGYFFGMGYIPKSLPLTDTDSLKPFLTPYKNNSFIQHAVEEYAKSYPERLMPLTHPIHPIH